MTRSGGSGTGRRGRAGWLTWLLPALLPLLGLLVFVLEPVLPIESGLGLHGLYQLRGLRPAPAGVVVVALDEHSAAALQLPERPRQWPRRLHADLVRQLHDAGARLVAFDLTFEAPSPDDAALARSLHSAGNVLLTSSLRTDVWRSGEVHAVAEQLRPAVAPIGDAALDQAPFVLPKERRVDAYWRFRRGADHMPSLPVLAFHLYNPEAFSGLMALSCQLAPASGCDAASRLAQPSQRIRQLRDRLVADDGHAQALLRLLWATPDAQLPAPRDRMSALLALHAADDLAMLSFYGPARSIRTVSYVDVAQAIAREPESFRDAMVFVGFSAETSGAQDRLRDDYLTVFSDGSGVDMSGVEIAATAFANLQHGDQLKPLAATAGLLLVLAWGAWLGLLAVRCKPGWSALLMAVSAVLLLGLAWLCFGRWGWWLPWAGPVLIQLPAAIVLMLWTTARRNRRQHDRLRHAFSYFVPAGAAEQLAGSADALGSASRVSHGVCMATDVEHYSAHAEAMPPQALGERLNAYYARLFEPIVQGGGAVMDIVGDAMLAVWESPAEDADTRHAACDAALTIQRRMSAAAAPEVAAWPTRIGLHAGEMRIGTVGARPHYQFRAVGDAVNTASRLEGLNKLLGTRLLASAAVVEGLPGVVWRPVGRFVLAGKQSPIDVVEVMALQADAHSDVLMLQREFAQAMAHYQAGHIALAISAFEALLQRHRPDGPSSYYLARCRQLLTNPADHDPRLPIRIDAK